MADPQHLTPHGPRWTDPPAATGHPPAPRPAPGLKLAGVAAGAIAVGLGSSYITVITATPSRAEVRELIADAITVVKETAILDRKSLSDWRGDQAAAFNGLRGDVQALQTQQARTNALLETMLEQRRSP